MPIFEHGGDHAKTITRIFDGCPDSWLKSVNFGRKHRLRIALRENDTREAVVQAITIFQVARELERRKVNGVRYVEPIEEQL